MQTIELYGQVSGQFHPCAEFSTPGDGSPVCEGCGWLDADHDHDHDHDHGIAPATGAVHALPVRRVTRPPKRLAS